MDRTTIEELLKDARSIASWKDGAGLSKVEELRQKVRDQKPADLDAFERMVEQGTAVRRAVAEVTELIRTRGPDVAEVAARLRDHRTASWAEDDLESQRTRSLFDYNVDKVLEFQRGVARKRDHEAAGGGTTVTPSDYHHRVDRLPRASSYDVVVDETGSQFDPDGSSSRHEGRLVGVVIPAGAALPHIGGFHGTEATPEELDAAVQAVLDAPVGVFGFSRSSIPQTNDDHWHVGVLELIEWVVRLLPVPETTTALNVFVEQRAFHSAESDWKPAITEMKRQFARRVRHLDGKFELTVRVVRKDGHAFLPYADAVANTWGSSWSSSRERLELSGLRGSCLIEGDLQVLADAWDDAEADGCLPSETWSSLLEQRPSNFIAAIILDHIAARLNDPRVADYYEGLLHAHLDSKSVHMDLLGLQVDWLEHHTSVASGPRGRLASTSARLARLNHTGTPDHELDEQLAALGESLLDEDPALVCLTDLRRVVSATNAFEFERGWRILEPWLERHPAIPGLQMWGRIQSTAGQLKAFMGQPQEARRYFLSALDSFGRLSDPTKASLESAHTRAYLAIAAMEDDSVDLDNARSELLAYLGVPSVRQASRTYANATDPASKYKHHVLVRYLVHRGTDDEQRHYLELLRSPRATGSGHPWELILFYRGWMLRNAGKSHPDVIVDAIRHTLASDAGPTLLLIGATLEQLAARWETPLFNDHDRRALHARLKTMLPAAANRVAALADSDVDDRTLLKQVLPFNFR